MTNALLRRAGAEALGTFSLVVVGCGAIVVNELSGKLGLLGIAAAFGLVVMVMVAATGHISGAHLNPAVTIAFAVTRHFPLKEVSVYLVAETMGVWLLHCWCDYSLARLQGWVRPILRMVFSRRWGWKS